MISPFLDGIIKGILPQREETEKDAGQ